MSQKSSKGKELTTIQISPLVFIKIKSIKHEWTWIVVISFHLEDFWDIVINTSGLIWIVYLFSTDIFDDIAFETGIQ